MSKWLKEADKWFSRYQRLRHADEYGFVKCSTCNSVHHFSAIDWGHWIKRGQMYRRFDFRNGGPQCKRCNRVDEGMANAMERYIRQTYGRKVPGKLKFKGEHDVVIWGERSLRKIIRVYRKLHHRLVLRRNEKMQRL